jgi:hypothetical protein
VLAFLRRWDGCNDHDTHDSVFPKQYRCISWRMVLVSVSVSVCCVLCVAAERRTSVLGVGARELA